MAQLWVNPADYDGTSLWYLGVALGLLILFRMYLEKKHPRGGVAVVSYLSWILGFFIIMVISSDPNRGSLMGHAMLFFAVLAAVYSGMATLAIVEDAIRDYDGVMRILPVALVWIVSAPAVYHFVAYGMMHPSQGWVFAAWIIAALFFLLAQVMLFTGHPSTDADFVAGHEDVRTLWKADHRGRSMELLSTVKFVDSRGVQWEAPAGTSVDGASMPRPLWALIGSPFVGKYRRGTTIHDLACNNWNRDAAATIATKDGAPIRPRPWDMHRAFYDIIYRDRAIMLKAQFFYLGVALFGPGGWLNFLKYGSRWNELEGSNSSEAE